MFSLLFLKDLLWWVSQLMVPHIAWSFILYAVEIPGHWITTLTNNKPTTNPRGYCIHWHWRQRKVNQLLFHDAKGITRVAKSMQIHLFYMTDSSLSRNELIYTWEKKNPLKIIVFVRRRCLKTLLVICLSYHTVYIGWWWTVECYE